MVLSGLSTFGEPVPVVKKMIEVGY